MGKTSKIFDEQDKGQSARETLKKCIKKKKRKKDLDYLRQQAVESKHALQKNTTQVKARKTTFGKTLADFAERRQAIDDNTQLKGKVRKQDQKKICPKLLADPFIGLFKNGARGNEVSREHEFFNETDKARVNGNILRILRGDEPIANKVADILHDQTSQTSFEDTKISRSSPVLVKSRKDKRKVGLIQGKKKEKIGQNPDIQETLRRYDTSSTDKLEEVSEDLLDSLRVKYQNKSGNESADLRQKVVSKTFEEEYKRGRDELVRRNQESRESLNNSFEDHEWMLIEKCKQICNTVSQQIVSENCFISTASDPLRKTRLSLMRLYSDSHRQHLLRKKVDFAGTPKLSSPSSSSVDSIETQRFANRLKEKTQHKRAKEKSLFSSQLRFDVADFQKNVDNLKQVTEGTESEVECKTSSEVSYNSESIQSTFVPKRGIELFCDNFLSRYKIKSNGQDSKQDSPFNLSQSEPEDSIKYPKTPNAKKVSRDKQSHLLNSKLNFMAAKSRQVQSRIMCSPPGKLYSTRKAEEKRKHVSRFEDLCEHAPPHHFSHNSQAPQPPKIDTNMFVNQEPSTSVQQQDFMLPLTAQNRNTQGIYQQAAGDCRLILLNPQPVPSFYSSALNSKQASDLNIMNGVENINLFSNTLSQPDIAQASSSNAQTHNATSQPIKFIHVENAHQVQRRVPVYFQGNNPYIAYFPSNDPNENNITRNIFPHEYVEHANAPMVQSNPRTVSCIQCANSAPGTVFCHRNVSTVPHVAHQNSFQANSQGAYHIDKACNSTVPNVRFINNNYVPHGVKVLAFDQTHGRNCGLPQLYVPGRQDL